MANKKSMREVVAELRQPRVALMLGLGFSSGLPFLLTGATLSYWLRESGFTLTTIGFLSWIGFAYTLKFLWSPVVDRTDVPLLGRLGRRRGWMLLTQFVIAVGLVWMGLTGPLESLGLFGVGAVITAFGSATQDIAVDAFRIESATDANELGLFTGAYQLGYRAAIITTDALILFSVTRFGWQISYCVMAVLMVIGVLATFGVREPSRAEVAASTDRPQGSHVLGFIDAVIGPFVAFFKSYGALALLMLLMITLYRLPDFVMGPMATPFYSDLGIAKDVVGAVRGTAGLAGSILGIATGGLLVARLGRIRALVVAGCMQTLSVSGFALLAIYGAPTPLFASVMAFDNFGVSIAGVALVTYMSSLTSLGYTATQYALLASSYTLAGKFLKGFSGLVVESLQRTHGAMQGYAIFFIGCGLVGLPAVLLCVVLARIETSSAKAERPTLS
ncbi:MAG: MFS transporter [Clostridia bacterium]|nr:MFS transporter [Deltaproteobacteria bacterium]